MTLPKISVKSWRDATTCGVRIVLNGYFPRGHSGGGFRSWWRDLTGSDESLDQEHSGAHGGKI